MSERILSRIIGGRLQQKGQKIHSDLLQFLGKKAYLWFIEGVESLPKNEFDKWMKEYGVKYGDQSELVT